MANIATNSPPVARKMHSVSHASFPEILLFFKASSSKISSHANQVVDLQSVYHLWVPLSEYRSQMILTGKSIPYHHTPELHYICQYRDLLCSVLQEMPALKSRVFFVNVTQQLKSLKRKKPEEQ